MKYYFRLFLPLVVVLAGACNDSEMGKNISGHWKAHKISIAGDTVKHKLNNSIELELEYPNYTFANKEVTETGEYYIRDQFLNLENYRDSIKNVRKIEILKFSSDSLELLLVDSTSQREVLFIR